MEIVGDSSWRRIFKLSMIFRQQIVKYEIHNSVKKKLMPKYHIRFDNLSPNCCPKFDTISTSEKKKILYGEYVVLFANKILRRDGT